MRCIKRGLVFQPTGKYNWWRSHAMAPSAIALDRHTIRLYIGCLDKNGISRIGYVDVDGQDPLRVLNVSEYPVLDLGRPGTFDDNGVFPASVTRIGDQIFLYYTGFELGEKVRYFMFGGLAVSLDNGQTFRRVSETPVTDRTDEGLYFRGGPCALFENRVFRMWYSSGSEWVEVGGKLRPTYDIRYFESADGINCPKQGSLCLQYDRDKQHGLGRPQILKCGDIYRLFYTIRTKDMHYLMGYAESYDGLDWEKKDDQVGIIHSSQGWDSQMVYFPSVIEMNNRYFLFYNGNNFGEAGFGFAEIVAW